MTEYLPIFCMFVLGIIFAGGSYAASALVAPNRVTEPKRAPYECGILPTREPAQRFPVRFYLVAMIFIVFDIEIIFLFPFAVIYQQLGAFGLIEVAVFAAAVFISFAYLISEGALDWGPPRTVRRNFKGERTSASSVRRTSNIARPVSPTSPASVSTATTPN